MLLNAESVKRLVTIATVIAAGGLSVAAWGFPKELGFEPDNRPAPDCPDPCSAITTVTGFQAQQLKQADGTEVTKFPTRMRRGNGWLVAFSVTLGAPNAEQREDFFNRSWGKPAQVRIAVLDPEPAEGDRRNRGQRYRLKSQSAPYDVRPWFGKKAWFVLKQRMHVSRGQVIALTTPTWAPTLATDLRPRERWRSSRRDGQCAEVNRDRARETIGQITKFECLHPTARLLFTALVVRKTPENKSR